MCCNIITSANICSWQTLHDTTLSSRTRRSLTAESIACESGIQAASKGASRKRIRLHKKQKDKKKL
jgi:hypothetical protein